MVSLSQTGSLKLKFKKFLIVLIYIFQFCFVFQENIISIKRKTRQILYQSLINVHQIKQYPHTHLSFFLSFLIIYKNSKGTRRLTLKMRPKKIMLRVLNEVIKYHHDNTKMNVKSAGGKS